MFTNKKGSYYECSYKGKSIMDFKLAWLIKLVHIYKSILAINYHSFINSCLILIHTFIY